MKEHNYYEKLFIREIFTKSHLMQEYDSYEKLYVYQIT